MANGLAGVAQSADRRRRRLSHEASEDVTDHEFESPFDAGSEAPTSYSMLWKSEFDSRLLRKLISSSLWKHVAAITFLVGLTIFCASRIIASPDPAWIQPLNRVAACLLLLSGQLALLIGWIRSESQLDFKGRYRWWTLLAMAILAVAILRITDTQVLAASLMVSLVEHLTGPLSAARNTVLVVPALVGGCLLVYRIVPDMQRCFGSQLVMVLAVSVAVFRLSWQHLAFDDPHQAIQASLDLAGIVLLFSSLLLHAHYVVYINHDPPVLIQKSVTEAVRASRDTEPIAPTAPAREPENDAEASANIRVAEAPSEDVSSREEETKPTGSTRKQSKTKRRRKNRKAA